MGYRLKLHFKRKKKYFNLQWRRELSK